MLFLVPEMELVVQLLTAGILVWEEKFTLSEVPSISIFRKKKCKLKCLLFFRGKNQEIEY